MLTVGSTPSSHTNVRINVDVSGSVGARDGTSECREVVINGILKNNCDFSQERLLNIAFATLSTVFPSLKRGDIESARVLQPQSTGESQGVEEEGLGSRSSTPPLCIAKLSSARLVRDVLRARCALANNYLTSNKINQDLLDLDASACMPHRKIFINEMLPYESFQAFKNLSSIAQGLSFKYVWHAGGRFLVRRRGSERAHVFVTASDQQAIHTAYQHAPKQHLPRTDLSNNANDRQEAVQISESAQIS